MDDAPIESKLRRFKLMRQARREQMSPDEQARREQALDEQIEKHEQILNLGKLNEPSPTSTNFITKAQLKKTLEAIVDRLNVEEQGRHEKLKEFGTNLEASFTNVFKEIVAMHKDVKKSFDTVFKLLGTRHEKGDEQNKPHFPDKKYEFVTTPLHIKVPPAPNALEKEKAKDKGKVKLTLDETSVKDLFPEKSDDDELTQ
ncbi:hypothetical protein L2E82_23005 [Cichorium intybus]|uniref:Uncharacterized protein n=1 Tax=Cichorium intybus TaxID=13427 RepID=A0ACB9DZN1_CICIN|nr:hypothetical protein L2E82_23005 [Cichorium intybus]